MGVPTFVSQKSVVGSKGSVPRDSDSVAISLNLQVSGSYLSLHATPSSPEYLFLRTLTVV